MSHNPHAQMVGGHTIQIKLVFILGFPGMAHSPRSMGYMVSPNELCQTLHVDIKR